MKFLSSELVGFQIVNGTAHSHTIYGTGDNDHSVPEEFIQFGLTADQELGTNILVGNG